MQRKSIHTNRRSFGKTVVAVFAGMFAGLFSGRKARAVESAIAFVDVSNVSELVPALCLRLVERDKWEVMPLEKLNPLDIFIVHNLPLGVDINKSHPRWDAARGTWVTDCVTVLHDGHNELARVNEQGIRMMKWLLQAEPQWGPYRERMLVTESPRTGDSYGYMLHYQTNDGTHDFHFSEPLCDLGVDTAGRLVKIIRK